MITVRYLNDDAHETHLRLFADLKISGTPAAAREAMGFDLYRPVCVIETDDLEEAFALMQNGVRTESWTLEPLPGMWVLVTPHVRDGERYGWRSACIGDVFERNGEFYVCARIGFERLAEPVRSAGIDAGMGMGAGDPGGPSAGPGGTDSPGSAGGSSAGPGLSSADPGPSMGFIDD